MESVSLSAFLPTGHVLGHLLLVKSPVFIVNKVLLAMTLLVTFLNTVLLKFSGSLSLSSMEEMCCLGSNSDHFLMSVTLK